MYKFDEDFFVLAAILSNQSKMNDYDLRQFNRMIKVIDAFLVGEVGLRDLVGTLSFLLGHLQEVPENWINIFEERWLLLEMINADVHEEIRKLTKNEHQAALGIARELKGLVQPYVD